MEKIEKPKKRRQPLRRGRRKDERLLKVVSSHPSPATLLSFLVSCERARQSAVAPSVRSSNAAAALRFVGYYLGVTGILARSPGDAASALLSTGKAVETPVEFRMSNGPMKAIAVVLIVAGLGIVAWGGFGFTTREKVLDVGPIHATKEKEHHVPYGVLAGAILALGGVVLLMKGRR